MDGRIYKLAILWVRSIDRGEVRASRKLRQEIDFTASGILFEDY
jgi:hypothetical protein